MVRPGARGRKNWLFLGSDKGGTAAAILYSVMAGAKANQVEPFAYLCNALQLLTRNSNPTISDLLPDVWLVSHPEVQRSWSR